MTDELEVTGSPMESDDILTMIDFTDKGEYSKATEIFNDQLMQRMDDALSQTKIAMADKMFNGVDPDDEEQLEMDLDDEEVDIDDEEIDDMADEIKND